MMKQLFLFLLTFIISNTILAHAAYTCSFGQNPDTITEKRKLIPVVQVFGQAKFDIEDSKYDFDLGRAHLGLIYNFNERWSSKIIIDRGRPTSVGAITGLDKAGNQIDIQNSSKEGAYYTMFLKFASLKWAITKGISIEGGAILQNHYITQERFWGQRYIAQTFQDMYWQIPSSDLGFIARYKINPIVGLDASITNGEGPRIKQDPFGKVKFSAGMDITPSEKIILRMFYHQRASGMDSLLTERMYSLFAGFLLHEKLRFGAEFNYMDNLNNFTDVKSYGYSLFSTFQIRPQTAFFLRFDRLINHPGELEITSSGKGMFILSGFTYSPLDGINMSLNYRSWLPEKEESKLTNIISLSLEYRI